MNFYDILSVCLQHWKIARNKTNPDQNVLKTESKDMQEHTVACIGEFRKRK